MNKPLLNKLFLALFVGSIFLFLGWNPNSNRNQSFDRALEFQDEPKLIFQKIETGMLQNDIKIFSDYFSKQIYLSLINGISGYYSANQAFYVLKDFLSIRQPNSFTFTKIQDNGTPYATGDIVFFSSGKKLKGKIFVSLSKWGDAWRISQITIR